MLLGSLPVAIVLLAQAYECCWREKGIEEFLSTLTARRWTVTDKIALCSD